MYCNTKIDLAWHSHPLYAINIYIWLLQVGLYLCPLGLFIFIISDQKAALSKLNWNIFLDWSSDIDLSKSILSCGRVQLWKYNIWL